MAHRMTGDTPPFGTDDALQLLLSERRRAVLRHLYTRGECVVSISELATAVWLQCDEPGLARADIEVALHHVDLPKLDAAGVVHYDAGSNRVLCPDTEPVAELLAQVERLLDQ